MDGSVWVLKAWQLDLEFPPSITRHLDQRLKETLQARYGQSVDIDALHVSFSTEHEPAVDADGRERFEQRLSLREMGREILNPPGLRELQRCAEPDRPLASSMPSLTLNAFFVLLVNAQWTLEHEQMLSQFWERHRSTWEILAKVGFLDGLTRLRARKRIDAEGYRLALDVLGLKAFPRSLGDVQAKRTPARSVVRGLALDGKTLPGIFHVRSNTTGHCFVHVLGGAPQCHEYISDDAPWNPARVVAAINASAWHRLNLSLGDAPGRLALAEPTADVFGELSKAQERFSTGHGTHFDAVESDDGAREDDHRILMPVEPALVLISTLDYWGQHEPLLRRIPTPVEVAHRVMGKWLKQNNVPADPRHVFIRYLRGSSATPWGHSRIAAAHVVFTPDEQPIGLSQALMSQFRARRAQGYDDEGGRWVVYSDADGQGAWSPQAEIDISALRVETYIASIDFLGLMNRRLERFWQLQGGAVEQSLWSTFVGQALLSLKRSEISRDSFALVTDAVQQVQVPDSPDRIRWSTLGFYLDEGLPFSTHCPPGIGLLVMEYRGRAGGVLYQPGQLRPFVPFRDRAHLADVLATAASDRQWRETLLNYQPGRYHDSLKNILELWGGVRRPTEAVSMLRPWTDALYKPATHAVLQHRLCEQDIAGSPIAFLREGLQRNSQFDAQDSIVTERELAISAWTQQANRLQLLLSPLALLMPAASVAALAVGAAGIGLNIQAASLPGDRQQERRQLLFAMMSFGLLQMAPATPRLLRAFSALRPPVRSLGRLRPALPPRRFADWLRRTTSARKTLFKPFFNGSGLMKTWSIPGNADYGTAAVQVWKLGRKFLLWTSDRTQARTLVVSSHGYYLPWTRTTMIPNGTELTTYAPHGHELVDPMLHRIASQSVRPYAVLNNAQTVPGPDVGPFPDTFARDTLMAGTSLPGRIKNYTLAKFQSEHYESYRDISQIVRNTHQPPLPAPLPATPMDVLTVRNRFGMTHPTLQNLFEELSRHGIHYDKILLVHCRCPAVGSLLGRAPSFVAPQGQSPITP
jgi:hypothetical protein